MALSFYSNAQEYKLEEKSVTGIFEANGKTKAELFSAINKWISVNYNSEKTVVQLSDTEGGNIIIKGITEGKYNLKPFRPKFKRDKYKIVKFNHLDEVNFCKIFKYNFKNTLGIINKAYMYPLNLKHYYQIYISNHYNIGTTIAQIKYYLETEGVGFLKDNSKTSYLMGAIAKNFIKKKLILSTVNSSLEIRKFLYILVSLNINLILFVKEVIKQLLHNKLHTTIKLQIIENTNSLSKDILDSNKEVIIVETFFYNLINIIYSPITEKKYI